MILEVTPRINNAEDVALKIHAESSTLRNGELINGGVVIDTRNFPHRPHAQERPDGGPGRDHQQANTRTSCARFPCWAAFPAWAGCSKKRDKTTDRYGAHGVPESPHHPQPRAGQNS